MHWILEDAILKIKHLLHLQLASYFRCTLSFDLLYSEARNVRGPRKVGYNLSLPIGMYGTDAVHACISRAYRVHGVSVANNAESCYGFITDHLEELGLKVDSKELVNIMDGYIGDGYGKCTEDDLSMR